MLGVFLTLLVVNDRGTMKFIRDTRLWCARIFARRNGMQENARRRRNEREGRGGGKKRGVITGERHSYRIWAQISLLITACTATYVLHRLSRTDEILLTASNAQRYRRPGVQPVSLVTMMDDYDGNFRGNAPLASNYSREMKRSVYVCARACVVQRWCLTELKTRSQ